MNAKEKSATAASSLKESVKKVALDGAEAIEEIGLDVKNQSIEIVQESSEAISADVAELNENVKTQFAGFKADLLGRVDVIKGQVNLSQQDLAELKSFVKAELAIVLEELSKLAKEIKDDVSQISAKHKDQLTGTLKRSKEHTLEVWHKVSTKQ